jgi:hypothetical protein
VRAAPSRDCREKNCPAAEVVRRAFNRSDATTEQENLSPSTVPLLTAEAAEAISRLGSPLLAIHKGVIRLVVQRNVRFFLLTTAADEHHDGVWKGSRGKALLLQWPIVFL